MARRRIRHWRKAAAPLSKPRIKSVVIDLKNPAGRQALLTLCERADVFVESFRPGVAKRLGVDCDVIGARNPRIVHCSISAFGPHGACAQRPADDLATEAMSGVLSITLGDDGEAAIPGIPAADVVSGLQGLSAVLMALLRRTATGLGDRIDISMHDAMVGACLNVLDPAIAEGRQQIAKHERTTGGAAFYRLYRTADGRHLALAGQEEKFIRNLLAALDRPDLILLCLQGPGPHQAPVADFPGEIFASKSLAEWLAWLEGRDICYGPVLTFPEMLRDPHLHARGMVLTDATGRRHIGPPSPSPPSPHGRSCVRLPWASIRRCCFPAGQARPSSTRMRDGRDDETGRRQAAARKLRPLLRGFRSRRHLRASPQPHDHRDRQHLVHVADDEPHPIHFEYASKSEFGRPLVNSCLTLSIVVGITVSDLSQKATGNLGWTDIKLTAPVFAGDTLYAESEVLAKRESASRPTQGIVTVRTIGKKQDGAFFISFERAVLVPKRGHAVDDAADY